MAGEGVHVEDPSLREMLQPNSLAPSPADHGEGDSIIPHRSELLDLLCIERIGTQFQLLRSAICVGNQHNELLQAR